MIGYKEAAALLGITTGHLRLLVHRREIGFYRVGKRTVRFAPDELRAWIESKRVGPAK